MIRYDLTCADGHRFEAWFANSAAFDTQVEADLVTCAICGGADVKKALMAPRVNTVGSEAASADPAAPASMLAGPLPAEIQARLAALGAEIERNSHHVGKRFASEARKMHLGEVEARAIHGEATREEAKALIDEGIPVAPLPFLPKRND